MQRKNSTMATEFVSEHQSRINGFIQHHDSNVEQERYKRKLRIKSMKRPHLSKDTLHQMYGTAHRFASTADSGSESRNPTSIRRHLGPITGFGDGNGSFWDRWLVKEPPPKSSFANGNAYPLRGYKRHYPERYQVYEKPRHDPNGQHAVHDLGDLVSMFPDNPLSKKHEKAVALAAAAAAFKRQAHHGPAPASAPAPDRKSLKTEAASAALLRFEERVKKSTQHLADSCVLVDPVLPSVKPPVE